MARSRFDIAYNTLKSDIIAGRYQPRQRLLEAELASALNVSRVTVRAVFIKLHEEGMVDLEPNRGASVRSLSLGEVLSAMEVRNVLKGLAASLAAAHATSVEIRELRGLLLRMEQASEATDYLTWSQQFDNRIVSLARNAYLSEALERLSYPIVRAQYSSGLSKSQRQKMVYEARAILGAIDARDSKSADRLMRKHLQRIWTELEQNGELEAAMAMAG